MTEATLAFACTMLAAFVFSTLTAPEYWERWVLWWEAEWERRQNRRKATLDRDKETGR